MTNIPVGDIINLAFHGYNLFKTEGVENKLNEMDKIAKSKGFQGLAERFMKGYADENLYDDAMQLLNPDERKKIDGFMVKLVEDQENGGKKVRDNLFQFFATEPDEQKRTNKLRELAQCEDYTAFMTLLKARGMRTPETETEKFFTRIFKTMSSSASSDEKKEAKGKSSFLDRISDDFTRPEPKGPLSSWVKNIEKRLEEKKQKQGGSK